MERLKKIGNIKSFASDQIQESRIGIGFEKLDRGLFDPEKAYDKVAATGAKWIRLQSGWARTETVKGVYSFEWLDTVVDNLIARGMTPWLCLCYGNGLYNEEAAKYFGAVGCPPIHTQEERDAWSNYVTATVRRYKGRIQWYEVWNEPDGTWCWKHGPSGTEYGEFFKLTAAAVKKGDPDAKLIGGCECSFSLEWLSAVLETGAAQFMDAFSYHNYCANEITLPPLVSSLKSLIHRYNPAVKMIQGETGTQSRSDGRGALRGGAWTQLKQAKYVVRHTINDFLSDIMFCSYFSCMDMAEALNGRVGDLASRKDFGYFGILSAEFDQDGIATGNYMPKTSYRTLQVLASVFRDEFELTSLPVQLKSLYSTRLIDKEESAEHFSTAGFVKPNGSAAFAYWKPTDLLTTAYEGTVTIESALPGTPRLVDLLDGAVYEIPENMKQYELQRYHADNGTLIPFPMEGLTQSRNNFIQFPSFPVKDYPLLLTFGDFFDME
ncbi:MAG: beta-galactosidase [Lentisphaeria bacterium]|nr:beta-galactosidase [Lentisphaeria bacterium]